MKASTGRLIACIVAAILILALLAAVLWPSIFRYVVHPAYTRSKLKSFEAQAQTAQPGQVVFLGDSIIDAWDTEGYFPGQTVYNQGIMGDSTFHVLARLEFVYALNPSAIVLLVGSNDFLNGGRSVEAAIADYDKILAALQQNCPSATVICQSLYPGYDSLQYKIEKWLGSITEFNSRLATLAGQYGYTYLNLYPALLDPATGQANRAFFKDGLHPNTEGYKLVAALLQKYL